MRILVPAAALLAGAVSAPAQCNREAVNQYRSYMEAGLRASQMADRLYGMRHSQLDDRFRREAGPYLEAMWNNFSKAAELGSPGGMYWVADMYERGWYVQQDRNKAAEFYERAAVCNQPGAEDSLGRFHEAGVVYPQSYQEAAKWYRRSAEHGYPDAYFSLGLYAMEGRTGPRDVKDAEALMGRACELAKGDSRRRFDAQDYCWMSYALSVNPEIRNYDQLGETAGRMMVAKADAEFARQWAIMAAVMHKEYVRRAHCGLPAFGGRMCGSGETPH
jgi:hypothetical protein